MSRKRAKIAAIAESLAGQELDPRYLGYFECFNRQEFFEAHKVLEELWLAERKGPKALFYQGLIQLAGAFVHLQKARRRPAAALFEKARGNLNNYPSLFECLDLDGVQRLIRKCLLELESGALVPGGLCDVQAPVLALRATTQNGNDA